MLQQRMTAALGEYVFGTDERELPEIVLDLLRERGWTAAAAESCTGGMVAARLTDIPGSSDVFAGGVVTYSNELKRRASGRAGTRCSPATGRSAPRRPRRWPPARASGWEPTSRWR